MANYRFIIGSGFFQCYQYVIKTEYPTTDYGALTDTLIDYLVAKGSSSILDMDNYEWSEDGETIFSKEGEIAYYSDEFVQGGNCGNVLIHNGEFRIEEISESDINQYDTIVEEAA